MKILDLCFITPNRETFFAALALRLPHLLKPAQLAGGGTVYVESGPEHAVEYVGPLVATPAILDDSTFPPTVVTPATYHDGNRANLRLMGAVADVLAFTLKAVSFPAGTVLLDPADVPADQLRWAGGSNLFDFKLAAPTSAPVLLSPTVTELRAQLKARLAAKRYDLEVGGVDVTVSAGVHRFDTQRETRSTWLALMGFAAGNPEFSRLWKTLAGVFITLTAADVAQIIPAIYAHIGTAFDREAALSANLDAADTLSALEALRPQIELFA